MALPRVGLHPLDDVVRNLVDLVKPGGWIQLVEMEWQVWEAGPVLQEFQRDMKRVVSMMTNGQGVDMREHLVTLFEEAGLKDIDYAIVDVPVGARPRKRCTKSVCRACLRRLLLRLTS
jgi:hypothetical protein